MKDLTVNDFIKVLLFLCSIYLLVYGGTKEHGDFNSCMSVMIGSILFYRMIYEITSKED